MKKIWRRLNAHDTSSEGRTWGEKSAPDEAAERAATAPKAARKKGGKDQGEAKRITTREAVRRFRAHALEDKTHDDVVRVGVHDAMWSDLYHHALTASWVAFVGWAFLAYVLINLAFALLYAIAPGEVSGPHAPDLADLFFFSVQTLSTIGYGVWSPTGTWTNSVVSIEALLGMMINALATGAVFARIARPKARIMFSNQAVISDENGVSALCIRLANCRRSVILSLDVEVALSRLTVTADGHLERQFEPLLLVQAHVPVLRFAFVLAHVITETSPLHQHSLKELDSEEAEIVVTVTGTDEAMGQTVFARTAYAFDRVLWNHRFVDIVHTRPNGGIAVDYSRFHDTEERKHAEEDAPVG